jgi:hypothetical protein
MRLMQRIQNNEFQIKDKEQEQEQEQDQDQELSRMPRHIQDDISERTYNPNYAPKEIYSNLYVSDADPNSTMQGVPRSMKSKILAKVKLTAVLMVIIVLLSLPYVNNTITKLIIQIIKTKNQTIISVVKSALIVILIVATISLMDIIFKLNNMS